MAKRHKILWLIKGLGPGGAERLLVESLPFLDRDTFEYEVAYLLPNKNQLVQELEDAGLRVICLGGGHGHSLGILKTLKRLIKDRGISLIHSHLPVAGFFARLAGRASGVKGIVYSEHNVLGAYHPISSFLTRSTYWMDDVTIAVSEGVNRSMLSWPILRPKSPLTILNGVSMAALKNAAVDPRKVKESLGIPAGNILIGNVAHIRPEKGHTYLLEAAQQVLLIHNDVTFLIVGGEKFPGMLEKLEDEARELGIENKVIFTGFREDARQLISALDIFVLSSIYEGLPIALLEAMALGIPSVVTEVGGVPEAIEDSVEGFLVKPRDSSALADRILYLIANPKVREDQSIAASEKVKYRFGMERMVGQIERVYLNVLRRNGEYLGSITSPEHIAST